MKILTISEMPTTPNMVKGAFQQAAPGGGVTFAVASTPAEMDAALDAGDVSLAFVDWEGDSARNLAAVARIKAKAPALPVLALCVKARANDAAALLKGAAPIVHKPFTPAELVTAATRAAQAAAAPRPSVNVEFINPFIDACKNVFLTMCQMQVEKKRLYLKEDHKMLGDISGVMGLSGVASGSVVVSMPAALACQVVGNMLGEPPAGEITQDVKDGIGEIINMISGHAKAALVKTKYHFTISIPTVVTGTGHEISHKSGTPNLVVAFAGGGYEFQLQVCLSASE